MIADSNSIKLHSQGRKKSKLEPLSDKSHVCIAKTGEAETLVWSVQDTEATSSSSTWQRHMADCDAEPLRGAFLSYH